MPLQATSGAASYDAFGGGVPVEPNYIESVFSTFLYTGNGSTQTINNGIDLAGQGGLVWCKTRGTDTNYSNLLFDTVRGATKVITSNTTDAESTFSTGLTAFNADGFSVGSGLTINKSGNTLASWTFRKQPKFFDVVTWTGNGATSRTISHNLGSAPGVLILKATGANSSWSVFHRSLGVSQTLLLNDTTGSFGASGRFGSSAPTATTFDINDIYNTNGVTYVAYLFAHDAGGFGLTGTDNVISCGSYTTDSSGYSPFVNLGYEPQWILTKKISGTDDWGITDNMRDMPAYTTALNITFHKTLFPNLSNAEAGNKYNEITPTGFYTAGSGSSTYIYIAIRRGPMKVPTDGTTVFAPATVAGDNSGFTGTPVVSGFPVDLSILQYRAQAYGAFAIDRLRGNTGTIASATSRTLQTFSTTAEYASGELGAADNNTGFRVFGQPPADGGSRVIWSFRRAPGFFDEVCYTGTGVARTVAHNLGVAPELMIVKSRSASASWAVYSAALAANELLLLNSPTAKSTTAFWSNTRPTGTVFSVSSDPTVNNSGSTYVAYLFASCPGVQSIQSYVGDGTTGRTINCGFTGGARFVCIKATSTTGSWWTFDSARGIVTNADPALQLNSTAAEITSADAIDTAASGFIVNQEATCSLNASGVTYLVWAIA